MSGSSETNFISVQMFLNSNIYFFEQCKKKNNQKNISVVRLWLKLNIFFHLDLDSFHRDYHEAAAPEMIAECTC